MIKFEISSDIVEIAPNNVSQVTLTVTNTSQIIDFFTVSIEPVISPETMGLYPGWVEFNQPTFSLRPAGDTGRGADSSQTIIIKINIPPQVYAGNYAGKIIVAAKSGNDNSAEIPFNIVISQIDLQTLEIQPIDSSSRKSTEVYRVIVGNQGNAPHIYSLYAEDPNDDLKFIIDPPEVPLRPGEQASITLKAQPRQRNWVGDEVNHDFKVKMEGSDQEVRGSFKQKAAIAPLHWFGRHWGRFVFFLALLLVLLIVGAIFLLPLIFPRSASAYCAPVSLRNVNVLSNGTTTNVLVSGRDGAQPYAVAVTEQSDKLPGIFASLVSVSPDGRRIAYVTASDLAMNDARIWIKNLDTDQAPIASIPITSGLWPVAPVWSANGEKLAYVVRHPTPITATNTVTATTPAASGNISGTTATTATTTTAATTAANGTPGAGAAPSPSQLDLYVVSKIGEDPKLLAAPQDLKPELFYGNTLSTIPLCWASDDASLMVRPQSSDNHVVQVALADGKVQVITPQAGGLQLPKPSLPSLPGLVLPLKSLVGVPASFLQVPQAHLASVQQQTGTGTPGTTTKGTGTGTSGTTPPATNPANACSIAHPFSQNDPRWADLPLKDGSTNTLAELGCPITAAAILLNYQQVDTTPSELSSCLGNLTSPLNQAGWFAIGQQCGGFKLQGGVRADFSWDLLDSSLQKGPTIVGLLGGPSGSHFLVVTGGFSGISNSYTVTDPWDGTTYKTLDYFLSKGYQPRWIISYEGTGAPCVTGVPDTTNQVGIRTTGAVDGGLYQTPQPFRYELTGTTNDTASAAIRVVNARANLDDSTQTLQPSETKTFATEGNYTIAITVKDPNGKTVLTRNIYFTIDHTVPVLGFHLTPTPDKTTNKSPVPVSVNLLATDDLSGIASIEYQVNGSQWQPYTSDTAKVPLTISDNGTYTINYRATDGAGNTAPAQTINFIIEKPVANATGTGSRPGAGGTGQATPTVNPNGAAGAGGAGGAKPAAPALSVPTVTPIPTQTPRPAVKNTPTVAPTAPPTTMAATPTITGTSLLPTGSPAITPTATVPLPTTEVITPTATVALAPVLVVTGIPITFLPDSTPQQIQLQNNGNAPLVWTLSPGDSSSLIGFSTTAGTVAVGGNATIDITVLAPNLTGTDQNTTFTINSNGGNQTVGVIIQSQPLPSATLSLIPASTSLNITNTIQVNVNVPNTKVTPNHIDLYATYKDCLASCTAARVKINSLTYDSNTLTTQWGTSNIVPQTGISLDGTLCMNQDCSVSQPIAALSNLSISLSANIDVSNNNNILPVSTTFTVTNQSERTKKVVINILVDNIQVQSLTADPANNWIQTWDTSAVSPSSTVIIQAEACNTDDNTGVCQAIPTPNGLHTTMGGDLNVSPNLDTSKSLTNTVSVVVTPTANVKSVTVTGFYTADQNTAQKNQGIASAFIIDANNTTFSLLVDPTSWPTQSGVTLNVNVCFQADGSDCIVLKSYTGLFVPAGDPAIITDQTAQPKYTTVSTAFPNPLSVKVTDIKSNPVQGAQVVFQTPTAPGVPSASFAGAGTSITVTSDANGLATVPAVNTLTANTVDGTFTVTVTINGFPGVTAGIQLNNTLPGAKPITIIESTNKQVAKIGQKFATPLQVQLDGAGPGITVTFTSQGTGVGATFPGSATNYTAVTDASGIATAGDLTANISQMQDQANYPIVGVHYVSASAPGYTPVLFSLTNVVGDPNSITPVLLNSATGLYTDPVASVGYTTTIDTSYPDIAVLVKDVGGNPLYKTSTQSVQVQFTSTAAPQPGLLFNNSTVTSQTIDTSSAQGGNPGVAIASGLKANLKAGAFNVTAVVVGFPNVNTGGFNFVNRAGTAASLEISTPATLTVQANTAYSAVLQATVYDKGHNTVLDSPTTQVIFASPTVTDRSTIGQSSVTFSNTTSTVYTATVTGGLGVAKVNVPVIGTCALGAFQLTASLAGVTASPATLNLSVIRGDPNKFSVLTGTNQHARISSKFSTSLQTTLQDSCGNSIPNQQVTFTTTQAVNQPGGSFNSTGSGVVSATVTTDNNGLATAPDFYANTIAVKNTSYTVTAASVAFPSAVTSPGFVLFNDPGVPKTITPFGAGSDVATPLSVTVGTKCTSGKVLRATVLDAGGNPVFPVGTPPADTKITFVGNNAASTAPGLSFDSVTNSTFPDDNGVITSTLPFTTTNKVGSYTVTAQVADPTVVGTFYMVNTPGAPTKIIPDPATTSTNPLQATVTIFNTGTSTPFNPLSVQILDQFDNVIPGAPVTFTAQPTLNNANHLATANFGTVPVTNDTTNLTFTGTTDSTGSLTASPVYPGFYSGNYPIIAQTATISTTFYMLNLPDSIPEAVNITASSSQLTTTVTTAFPKFSAFVTDANGNGINSINVTFTLQGTTANGIWLIGANGVNTERPTDGNGYAVINKDTPNPDSIPLGTTDLQANTTAGTFSVVASVQGRNSLLTTSIQMTNVAERKVVPGVSTVTFTPPTITGVPVDQTFGSFNLFVTDQYQNPIGSYPISFTVPVSATGVSTGVFSGSGNTKTVQTDNSGNATVPAGQLTAGIKAGNFDVTANVPVTQTSSTFVTPLPTITLTNLAGAPDASHITTSAGSTPVRIIVGGTYTTPISVTVADKYNNPVSSPTLSYTISPAPSASPTVASADFTTPMDPAPNTDTTQATINSIKANTVAGNFTITAHANGVTSTSPIQVTNIPDYPDSIAILSGNNQTPEVGQLFTTTLQVQVTDQFGNLVGANNPAGNPNYVVFTAPTSGPSAIFTNTNGVVSNIYTSTVNSGVALVVGGSPNGSVRANNQLDTYNITLSVPGRTLSHADAFTVTNTADLKLVSTTTQVKQAGGEAFAPLQVQVSGANGTGVPNLPVTFSVSDPQLGVFSGGTCTTLNGPTFDQNGTAITKTVNTGADGTASVSNFCAGTLVGNYVVTATTTIGGASKSVQIKLANTAQFSTTNITGNNQTAVTNGGVFNPLGVQVIGYNSTSIPNAQVSFAVTNTTFAVITTPQPTTSNSGGIATANVTAGNYVGSYNVNATMSTPSGVFTQTFTLTNTVKVVFTSSSPVLLAGSNTSNGQTGNITAQVQDGLGNGMPNVNVQFAISSGDTNKVAFSGASAALSNASGNATVTLRARTQLGVYTITATPLVGTNSVGDPASLQGTTSATLSTTSAPTPLAGGQSTSISVNVSGFNNVNVSGAAVIFSIPSAFTGMGTVTSTAITSSGSGVAQTNLTTGNTAGTYNVLATLDPAQFNPGPAPTVTTTIPVTNRVNISYNSSISTLLLAGGVDGSGNPVQGQTASLVFTATGFTGGGISGVNFAVTSDNKNRGFFSGGTISGNVITGTTATTGANGQANMTLIGGNEVGTYNLTAVGLAGTTQISANTLSFGGTTTASLSTPSSLVFIQAGGDTQPISVTVTGNSGALVSNAPILFASNDTNSLSTLPVSTTVNTNASGVANLFTTSTSKVGFYTVTGNLSMPGVPLASLPPAQNITVVNTATINSTSQASPLAGTTSVPISATVTGFNNTPIPGASVVFSVPTTYNSYANFSGNQAVTITTSSNSPNTGVANTNLTSLAKAGRFNVQAALSPSQFGGNWNPTTTATIPITNMVTISISSNPASPNLSAASNSTSNNGGTATITANVVGAGSVAVSNVTVNFGTDAPDKGNVSPTSKDTNGVSKTVTTTLTASNGLGTYNVTAQAFSLVDNTLDVGSGAVSLAAKTSATFSGSLTASNPTPLAGGDTSQVTAFVTGNNGQAVQGATVVFTSSDTTKGTITGNSVSTGADGKATVTVTTGSAVGPYTITAGLANNPTVVTANATLTNTVTLSYDTAPTPLAGGGTATFVVTANGAGGSTVSGVGLNFTGVNGGTAPGGSAATATTGPGGTATITVTSNTPSNSGGSNNNAVYGGWTLRAAATSGGNNVSNNGSTYNIPVTNTLLITTTAATASTPPRPVANGGTGGMSVQVYGFGSYTPNNVSVSFSTSAVSGASLCGNQACGTVTSSASTSGGGVANATVTARTGSTVSPTTAQSYDVQAQINIGGITASLPTAVRVFNTVKVTATQTGSNLSTSAPMTVTVTDNQNNTLSGLNVQFVVMNQANTAVGSTTTDGYLCINTCTPGTSTEYLGIRMATVSGMAGLNFAQTVQTASTTGSNLDTDYAVLAAGTADQGASVIGATTGNVFNIKAVVLMPGLPIDTRSPSVSFNLKT